MSKINIRESLRNMDADSCCKYDLLTMYDACLLTDEDKADIAKLLFDNEDPEVIYQKLCTYFCDDDVSELTGLNDVQNVTPFEAIISNVKMGLDQKYDSVFYNDVAGQFEITSKDTTYTFGLSPVEYETDGISLYVDYNYDVPINYTSIKEASEDILTKCNEKVSTASQSNAILDDDTMEYTVYDVVEDEGRLCAKCMNESTNSFEDIKLGKVNSDAVNELLNNILNNPNYKLTNDCRKKIADNSAPWGIVMSPGFDITATNALMSTGDFGGSVSFGESEQCTFENGDRVTDGNRKGTVIDCDSIKVLVDWDYSDTDDIEWVMKEDLSFVNALKESSEDEAKLQMNNKYDNDIVTEGIFDSKETKQKRYADTVKDVFGEDVNVVANNVISYASDLLQEVADSLGDESSSKNLGNSIIRVIKNAKATINKTPHSLVRNIASIGQKYERESINLKELQDFLSKVGKLQNSGKDGYKAMQFLFDKINNSLSTRIDAIIKTITNEYGLIRESNESIQEDDDLISAEQEFDSAATSINSNKLPAVYSMVRFNPGDVVVDFGGGKFDNAVNYLKDNDVTLLVYDPYNRSAEHNKEVLRILKEHGGADAAVNSNVLNVIKEPEAREAVLRNIKKITKRGAPIYITVYEGRGDAKEGPTKSGYQLNRRTADYLDEIREVFPDANRKGKLIVATNSRTLNSSTNIKASSTEGYVYTYCDECGKKNRVKVTFNNFNEPFNDTEYKCKYCGTNNLLTDPHSYDKNGNLVEASQDEICKAISGDNSAIQSLKKQGYKINRLANPLQISEVGTYEITDTSGNKFNYDNTIINDSADGARVRTESGYQLNNETGDYMNESIVTDASNIGQGYAAPIMVSLVTQAKELAKEYKNNKDKDGFERLLPRFEDNILDYKSEIEEKIKDFDKYWEVHKKAMLDNISEAVSILKNIGIPGLDSKLSKLDESYSDDEWVDKMWEAFHDISGIKDISEGKNPNTYVVTFDTEGSATARARILLKALIKAGLDIELDSSNGSNVFTFITPTNEWEFIKGKMIKDSDGFLTSYDWYRNTDSGLNIFMFGADEADPDYADWETESDTEAEDWFNSYTGFDEE